MALNWRSRKRTSQDKLTKLKVALDDGLDIREAAVVAGITLAVAYKYRKLGIFLHSELPQPGKSSVCYVVHNRTTLNKARKDLLRAWAVSPIDMELLGKALTEINAALAASKVVKKEKLPDDKNSILGIGIHQEPREPGVCREV